MKSLSNLLRSISYRYSTPMVMALFLILSMGCSSTMHTEKIWMGEKVRYEAPTPEGVFKLAKEVNDIVENEDFMRTIFRHLDEEWKLWGKYTEEKISFKGNEINLEEFFFGQRSKQTEEITEISRYRGGIKVMAKAKNPRQVIMVMVVRGQVPIQRRLAGHYLFFLVRNRIIDSYTRVLHKVAEKHGIPLKLKDFGQVPASLLWRELGPRKLAPDKTKKSGVKEKKVKGKKKGKVKPKQG